MDVVVAHAPSRIGQIALSVSDLAHSKQFWQDVVGLRFLFEAPNVVFFDIGGQRLMLGQSQAEAFKPEGCVLYFDVSDLDASFAALRDRGAFVQHEPVLVAPLGDKDLWMAFFRDPDSHLFGLMCERERG